LLGLISFLQFVSNDWRDFNEEMTVACQAIGSMNGATSGTGSSQTKAVPDDEEEEEQVSSSWLFHSYLLPLGFRSLNLAKIDQRHHFPCSQTKGWGRGSSMPWLFLQLLQGSNKCWLLPIPCNEDETTQGREERGERELFVIKKVIMFEVVRE
jgi:hypothetical protein